MQACGEGMILFKNTNKVQMMWSFLLRFCVAVCAIFSHGVYADYNGPKPWQFWVQTPSSPMAHHINQLHSELMVIIISIAVFVMLLLIYTLYRFNHKRNPVPSKTTHNVLLEVIWTTIPVIIILYIALPSVRLVMREAHVPKADMSLKVIAHQWYWTYELPDHQKISFDSRLIPDKDLKPGQLRLLDVDNPLVLPIQKNIRVILTSEDVLHSWAVPSLGIKMDTVPGRLNELTLSIDKEGSYYGQCSEICGINHGFMPISIKAVSQEKFEAWVLSHNQGKPLVQPAAVKPISK
jgi:cytochrome c oxidase subunit II